MKDIKITLLWKPKSTQHLYWWRWRIKFMKKDAKELKADYIQQIMEQYKGEILEGSLEMDIKLYFNDKRRRDFDNYHKISIDSLSWTVMKDDVQIIKAVIQKYLDRENPRIEFIIKDFVDKK